MKQLICCFIKVQPARRETSDCFSSPPELADAKVFSQPAGCDQRLCLWNLRFFEKNRVKLSSFCCAKAPLFGSMPGHASCAQMDLRPASGGTTRLRVLRPGSAWRRASATCIQTQSGASCAQMDLRPASGGTTRFRDLRPDSVWRHVSRLSLVATCRHRSGRRLRRRQPR